ncbi:hypothetical protein [Micromonospora sp. NPDC048063]|uniref:hypothetical protein n=1 Tax=Micromonospora sp. NPDC048063 TaxID=3364256 RepID=UPI003719C524
MIAERWPFTDGETIEDALTVFVGAGLLPPGTRVLKQTRMFNPYPWQPDGYNYRWTVSL